jgi:hypothetical protein
MGGRLNEGGGDRDIGETTTPGSECFLPHQKMPDQLVAAVDEIKK